MAGIMLGRANLWSWCSSSQRIADPAMRKTPKERAEVPTVLRKIRARGTSGGLSAACRGDHDEARVRKKTIVVG